jgi:hypothetical protein
MFIDVGALATSCIILPPVPSVIQERSSDACVYRRGSVRRASGLVRNKTGKSGRGSHLKISLPNQITRRGRPM